MKRSLTVVIWVLWIQAGCKQEAEELNRKTCESTTRYTNTHADAHTLQNMLENYVSSGIPGVTAVIHSKARGFFYGQAGYSELVTGALLAPCHTFRIASLTKTFLATAILQLAEENVIDLQTPVKNLLPPAILEGLANVHEATVFELLNHTSGIPNYDDNIRFVAQILNEPGTEITLNDRLDYAKELEGTPDWVIEKYGQVYSNTNYVLLQLILEEVTRKGYESHLGDRFVASLGLESVQFGSLESFPAGLASGYCDLFDNGKLRDVSLFDANRWSGEGAMIANAIDTYTFFEALLSGQLISEEMLHTMQTNRLGFLEETIQELQGIGHDGQGVGYSSEMWYFPELELTVVLLANQGRISADQPSIQAFEQLLKEVVTYHLP